MATALVLGYSAFDLGLFSDKDPRLKLIKKAIRKDLEAMQQMGCLGLCLQEVWVLNIGF